MYAATDSKDSWSRMAIDLKRPSKNAPGAAILPIGKSSEWFLEALHEPPERRQTTSSLSHPIGVAQFRLDHFLRRFHRFAICTASGIEAKPTFNDFLIGPIFGFFAIDTQEQVKVIVHGAKATDGDRKDLVQFFESLVNPFFPMETVLIGKQMCLAAVGDCERLLLHNLSRNCSR